MDWLRRWVFHNAALKLLALASAVLLWYAVAEEPRAEVAHTVPIEFANTPPGIAINSDKVPEVQIWLSGPTRLVREVSSRDLHPVIDLSGTRPAPGERTYSLNNASIKAPQGVDIVQIIPSEFHLSFDAMARRLVKVVPRVSGSFGSATSDPAAVTIQGPRSRVEAIQQALTDPIDGGAVRASQTFTVTAYVNDPLVRVVEPVAVRVTVQPHAPQNPSSSRPSEHN
jgi:YbbR domain-containing protein